MKEKRFTLFIRANEKRKYYTIIIVICKSTNDNNNNNSRVRIMLCVLLVSARFVKYRDIEKRKKMILT